MTPEQVKALAHQEWCGLYGVHLHQAADGDLPEVWAVRLHAPNGPLYFITEDGPYCRCCTANPPPNP